jgi:hypothetical protein
MINLNSNHMSLFKKSKESMPAEQPSTQKEGIELSESEKQQIIQRISEIEQRIGEIKAIRTDEEQWNKLEDTEAQKLFEEYDTIKNEKEELQRKLEGGESIPEDFVSIKGIKDWLKQENLEQYIDIEKEINEQEQFYKEFYGQDFQIDRARILIEKNRLPLIKHGLEKGAVNSLLVVATPEQLTKKEQKQTEAEYAYYKFLEPLKQKGIKIWGDKKGEDRHFNLSLDEWLKKILPVEIDDFNPNKLDDDDSSAKEVKRIAKEKGNPQKQQANKLQSVFIDNRSAIPAKQILITQKNMETTTREGRSFNNMIKEKIKTLTPEQWIILQSQLYKKNGTYLSPDKWEWLMAILKSGGFNSGAEVARVGWREWEGIHLDSESPYLSTGIERWRSAL